MKKYVFLSALIIGWTCGPVISDETSRNPRKPLSEEEIDFSREFTALLDKYPAAGNRFHLADFGVSRSVAWTPSTYECDRFEGVFGEQWVECHVAERQ